MSSQFIVIADNTNIFTNMYEQLSTAPTMAGVSLVYGEENRYNLNYDLPMVVYYPTQETYMDNKQGYIQNLNTNYSIVWFRRINFNFMLWAESTDPLATPQMHADQINILIGNVLSAFRYVQPDMFKFLPKSSHWEIFQDAKSRYGRSYNMNVVCDVPVLSPDPVMALVKEVDIIDEIED